MKAKQAIELLASLDPEAPIQIIKARGAVRDYVEVDCIGLAKRGTILLWSGWEDKQTVGRRGGKHLFTVPPPPPEKLF